MSQCVIQGVFTDVGRAANAQSMLGPLVRPPYHESYFSYYKIGEGGYQLGPGGSKQPKTPDPSRIDLESVTTPGLFTFQKSLTAADLSIEVDGTITYAVARCFLDYTEANDNGSGGYPEFFEIGIFDANNVMLIYATFPGETKNASKTLNHIIKANF
jgi:hypothetical protein